MATPGASYPESATAATNENPSSAAPPVPEKPKRRFSVVRVLLILLVLLAVAAGGAAIWIYGWPAPVQAWFRPELVPAGGQIFYEGKPIPAGTVMTAPLDGQPAGAIGLVQEDGRFKFETQVGDRYSDGIYVGRHKVAVSYGQPRIMGIIPLVPEKYFTLADTVLTIEVSDDPERNHFEFKLEGELTEEAQRFLKGETGGNEWGPPAEGGVPGGPPRADSDAEPRE